MGDPLTKVLLTTAQLYVSKHVDYLISDSEKKITSIVGDDHISLSNY
jgi:hypothetical protein